jgi:hypothetical protein
MSVLNIVELQNVVTSASGITPVGYLSNQVTNIQQMVDYGNKQINVNSISNFSVTPIQVYAGLNLCNVSLSYNGVTATGAGATTTSTLGTVSTGFLSLGISTGTGLLFTQGTTSTFVIGSDSNATFTGTVTAAGFVTASDYRLKSAIRPITDYETILSSVEGVRFQWKASGEDDVGIIAQQLLPVLPEAVHEVDGHYKVEYMKIIPVLIQSVKALQERVTVLERGCRPVDKSN